MTAQGGRAANRLAKKRQRRHGTALIAALGALTLTAAVMVTASVTSAAQTDQANVNLSSVAIPKFGVGVVDRDGVVAAATEDSPLPLRFEHGSELIPGGTATATLTVFNNSERLANSTDLHIAPIGDGSVTIDGQTRPNITQFLRFTIKDAAGTVLLRAAPIAQAGIVLPELAPRGDEELEPGDTFEGGADESTTTLTIEIQYVNYPETADYVTGRSAIGISLHSTSAAP